MNVSNSKTFILEFKSNNEYKTFLVILSSLYLYSFNNFFISFNVFTLSTLSSEIELYFLLINVDTNLSKLKIFLYSSKAFICSSKRKYILSQIKFLNVVFISSFFEHSSTINLFTFLK